jgi:hypothetical protein
LVLEVTYKPIKKARHLKIFADDFLGIPCQVDGDCEEWLGVCTPAKRCAMAPLAEVDSQNKDIFCGLLLMTKSTGRKSIFGMLHQQYVCFIGRLFEVSGRLCERI